MSSRYLDRLKSSSAQLLENRWGLSISGAHIFFISYMALLYATGFFKDWQELVTEPYFLLRGLKNYTDISTHHAPLLTELLAVLYSFFGTGEATRVILLISTGAATALLTFRASYRLAGKRAGLCSIFLFTIVWPFYGGMNFWFDSFLPIFYLIAFVLITGRYAPRWFFLAGISMGLSFLVKQHGGVVALAVLLMLLLRPKDLNGRLKECSCFSVGVLTPIIAMSVWYALSGQIGDAYFWMIKYNLSSHYVTLGVKPPPIEDVIRLIYVVVPIVLFLGTARHSESMRKQVSWDFLLVLVMGFCASLTIIPRWERWHVIPSVPFLVIGLVFSCKSLIGKTNILPGLGRQQIMTAVVSAWIVVVLLDIGTYFPPMLMDRVVPGSIRHWPLRSYAVADWFDEDLKRLIDDMPALGRYLRDMTGEDEKIFVWGWMGSGLYFESARLPAGRFYYTLPWFTCLPQFRKDLLMAFEEDLPRFVVDLKTQYPGTATLSDLGIDLERRGFVRLSDMSEEFPQVLIWRLRDT
jgi:hypothetical protein